MSPPSVRLLFDGQPLSFPSVSSVVERMKAKIAKDRRLRKRLVKLKEEINMSQEQT